MNSDPYLGRVIVSITGAGKSMFDCLCGRLWNEGLLANISYKKIQGFILQTIAVIETSPVG
jgi:hypothetical protein